MYPMCLKRIHNYQSNQRYAGKEGVGGGVSDRTTLFKMTTIGLIHLTAVLSLAAILATTVPRSQAILYDFKDMYIQ